MIANALLIGTRAFTRLFVWAHGQLKFLCRTSALFFTSTTLFLWLGILFETSSPRLLDSAQVLLEGYSKIEAYQQSSAVPTAMPLS